MIDQISDMRKYIKFSLLILLVLSACKSRNNELDMPGYEMDTGEIQIPEEALSDIIQNISSPIEMAALVKDLGVPYDNDNLINTDKIHSYSTNFKMAYTLGMLGADLGYLNVYNKTGSSVSYLSAINKLADALKVSQFFDFNTIKRLATSNSSLDSLIFLSVHSFNQMDEHLRETDRSNLSALMIAGIWIEGMYQVTQVVKNRSSEELAEYIGEQKLILNDLLLILNNYSRDDQFASLIYDYEKLKNVYDHVKITYETGEPETREEEGMLVVVQEEKSIVDINKDVLNSLVDVIAIIRNKHLEM